MLSTQQSLLYFFVFFFGTVVFHFERVPCWVGVRCSVLFFPVFRGQRIENYKY